MLKGLKFLKNNRGFTLIELLVVITIIAILAGVIIANLQSARKKAVDATIRSDVKAMMQAVELFSVDINKVDEISTNSIAQPVSPVTANKVRDVLVAQGLLPKTPDHPDSAIDYTYKSCTSGGTLEYTIYGKLVSEKGAAGEDVYFYASNGASDTAVGVANVPDPCS